jgi:hypothetical protein
MIFILLIVLSGCASIDKPLDPTVFYRRDAKLSINGKPSTGVAVLPEQGPYDITVETGGTIDLVKLETCHRFVATEPKGKSFLFHYEPLAGLEDIEGCPVKIEALEKERGRHGWAFMDRKTPGATLPAKTSCNGEVKDVLGVSICQAKAGLNQRIEFPVPVAAVAEKGCELVPSSGGKIFDYVAVEGECVFAFVEKGGAGRAHRHWALGFKDIVLGGER